MLCSLIWFLSRAPPKKNIVPTLRKYCTQTRPECLQQSSVSPHFSRLLKDGWIPKSWNPPPAGLRALPAAKVPTLHSGRTLHLICMIFCCQWPFCLGRGEVQRGPGWEARRRAEWERESIKATALQITRKWSAVLLVCTLGAVRELHCRVFLCAHRTQSGVVLHEIAFVRWVKSPERSCVL